MATTRTGFVRWGIVAAVLGVLAIAGTAVSLAQSGPGGVPPRGGQGYTIHLVVDGTTFRGFVGVSGLASETEVIEFRDGSDPDLIRKTPGPTKWGDITLKRGVTGTDALWDWREQVIDRAGDFRKNGSVIVYDRSGAEVARYNFFNGWPAKWEGPTLSGEGNEVAIETISIAVERIEKD